MPDDRPPPNLKLPSHHYQGKGSVLEPGPKLFESCYPWVFKSTQVTSDGGQRALKSVVVALKQVRAEFTKAHKRGGRVWFIGNGGSAAIASHLAVDFTKNGGIRAMAMNDAPMLTCLGNDFGYDRVFGKQIEYQASGKDIVVIISTSGRSLNIISAADAARVMGCTIYTLSGMNPNNLLRRKGNLNFYVPCTDYGIVETSHLILMHSIVEGM